MLMYVKSNLIIVFTNHVVHDNNSRLGKELSQYNFHGTIEAPLDLVYITLKIKSYVRSNSRFDYRDSFRQILTIYIDSFKILKIYS